MQMTPVGTRETQKGRRAGRERESEERQNLRKIHTPKNSSESTS